MHEMVGIPYETLGLGFVSPNCTCSPVHVSFSFLNITEMNFAIDMSKAPMEKQQYYAFRIGVPQKDDFKASLCSSRQGSEVSCDEGHAYIKNGSNGAVGDVTITGDNDSKPPIGWIFLKPLIHIRWIFLKPLTKELWLAIVGFIFFTAFVVWMIERSINPQFQGSTLTQFCTAFYFALSTLTFSYGQILIRSPLSKLLVLVWFFALLVLWPSYTTNLSSMPTGETTSTSNGSSATAWAPLTLRSFSGLFVVTGCVSTLMLLISIIRSVYAKYNRVRGSESQSADDEGGGRVRLEEFSVLQINTDNGSVTDQRIQEVRDTDCLDAHRSGGDTGDEEAGRPMQDIMSNASVPEVSVQIEMTSTGHGAGLPL